MSFDLLFKTWNWKPIRHCSGRYVLRGAGKDLRPEDIAGSGAKAREYKVVAARDAVLVVILNGGGLISYRRKDGSFLHTLNTPEGFRRKLSQLKIELPALSDIDFSSAC